MCTTIIKTVQSPPRSDAYETVAAATAAAGTGWRIEARLTGSGVQILQAHCVLLVVADLGIRSFISENGTKMLAIIMYFLRNNHLLGSYKHEIS